MTALVDDDKSTHVGNGDLVIHESQPALGSVLENDVILNRRRGHDRLLKPGREA